ncbi:HpcH/HpaI aldolase/citrate lyase family protein, partial [Thermodesulfobacteriota bacterium]
MEKAVNYQADVLVLDLEDSVPDKEKVSSRALVKQSLSYLKGQGQICYIRINGFVTGLAFDDLDATICPELDGVILPKVETIKDMKELDVYLTLLERKNNIETGSIETTLTLETAKAMKNAYEIAVSSKRIRNLVLAAGPGGDANRAIGYIWSKDGKETLFLRSKSVLDARAAGIHYPMISSWWDIKDLNGLERDALLNRQIGFRGQVVIHPSHVPVVNKVFTPSIDEISYYKGLIKAVEEAEKKGTTAIVYEGDMVDTAMVKTAREMLEFASSIGLEV